LKSGCLETPAGNVAALPLPEVGHGSHENQPCEGGNGFETRKATSTEARARKRFLAANGLGLVFM
jgi:hypothetical protein